MKFVGDFWALDKVWKDLQAKAAAKNIEAFEFGVLSAMPGLFANWPTDFLVSSAYGLHDILVTCTFDREPCEDSSFTLFRDPEMINCYTFHRQNNTHIRSGPRAGLTLHLYIGR